MKSKNESKDLISVIVPAYNAEKYLSKCLDSILSQTYTNLEIIVINDGSQDATLSIAKGYADKDSRVHIIDKKNQGVSAARNRGIAESNGAFISFVDADDWVHPYMIEALHSLMIKNNTDLAACGIVRTNKELESDIKKQGKECVYTREEYLKKYFKIGTQETVYYCNNKLYKRTLIDYNLFPDFEIGEDVISTFKAINRSNSIATTDLSLYYYRQGSGITTAFNDKYFQLIDVWEEVVNLAKHEEPNYVEWQE